MENPKNTQRQAARTGNDVANRVANSSVCTGAIINHLSRDQNHLHFHGQELPAFLSIFCNVQSDEIAQRYAEDADILEEYSRKTCGNLHFPISQTTMMFPRHSRILR